MKSLRIGITFGLYMRIGGHFKSGLSLIRQLALNHHTVHVFIPGATDEMLAQLKSANAIVHIIPKFGIKDDLPLPSAVRALKEIATRHELDLLHSQDLRSGVCAYLVAAILAKPFVHTIAGGSFHYAYPPTQSAIISYSREIIDQVHEAFGTPLDHFHLIPGRIDTTIYKPIPTTSIILDRLEIQPGTRSILVMMRMYRHLKPYFDSLLRFAETSIESRHALAITIPGDGRIYDYLVEQADRINSKVPDHKIIHLIGPILTESEMNSICNAADLIIGTGRSLLEGMACRKAAIILGGNYRAQLISEENIGPIAYYNFSGRHFDQDPNLGEDLYDAVERVMKSNGSLEQAANFSYDFIQSRMSAQYAFDQYMKVYETSLQQPTKLSEYARWKTRALIVRVANSIRIRKSRLLLTDPQA